MDDDEELLSGDRSVGRSSRRKKRWSELSDGQRAAIILGALVELVVTTIAFRDLVRRPTTEVRGRKPLWALTFFVQPFGPLAYLLVGRRRARP